MGKVNKQNFLNSLLIINSLIFLGSIIYDLSGATNNFTLAKYFISILFGILVVSFAMTLLTIYFKYQTKPREESEDGSTFTIHTGSTLELGNSFIHRQNPKEENRASLVWINPAILSFPLYYFVLLEIGFQIHFLTYCISIVLTNLFFYFILKNDIQIRAKEDGIFLRIDPSTQLDNFSYDQGYRISLKRLDFHLTTVDVPELIPDMIQTGKLYEFMPQNRIISWLRWFDSYKVFIKLVEFTIVEDYNNTFFKKDLSFLIPIDGSLEEVEYYQSKLIDWLSQKQYQTIIGS